MPHIGYYINLDRSHDRRAAIEGRLRNLEPPAAYQRFPAAAGNTSGFPNPRLNDAQIGCFTSHYLLLQRHRDGADHLHIIEDDVVLACRTVQFVEQVIASGMLDDLDILFTSGYLPEDFVSFRTGRHAWRTLVQRASDGTATDIQFIFLPYFASTASYIVNRRSIPLICDILGRELELGARGPIDLFIREEAEQGRLRAKCLFPFISSVAPAEFVSTIDHDDDKRMWTLVMDLLRHSFFVECDPRATFELADRILRNPRADWQERLHARIAGFLTSDAYRPF